MLGVGMQIGICRLNLPLRDAQSVALIFLWEVLFITSRPFGWSQVETCCFAFQEAMGNILEYRPDPNDTILLKECIVFWQQ